MQNDLSAFWMPFTNNRAFKGAPRLLSASQGVHYFDVFGRAVLDGTSGLWCVNAGHCRPEIVSAIQDQAGVLDYASSFQMSYPAPFELARRLAAVLPGDLDHIFFTNSGSESVDTALKFALAYHALRGDGRRTRLIGRERGYHGVGFGGISVGGIVNNRRWFGPLLPGTDHIRHTFDPARRFTRGQAEVGQEYADDLLRLIDLHGAETIAAVIVEPMAGSTGVLPPPKGYLERLRKICTDHGILLIFDEVITAFGRVGAMTAAERVGVTPDLIALAKGISNGAIPMGAVAASRSIYETFMEKSASGIEFFHGYTTSAHPLAVAAASATLDLFAREKLCERALALEPGWEDAVHRLADARHVVDVRNFGLAAGIELAPRDGASGARANETLQQCFDAGLQIRTTGDTIALSPPVIFSPADVEETVAKIRSALDRVA